MTKLIASIAVFCVCSYLSAQQTMGLFVNNIEAFDGYTLFGNNRTTYLIDNCGFVVNNWESEHKPGLGMYLLANGNLLRTAQINGAFNAGGKGGRFELFSWDGNLIWRYDYANNDYHAHHDIIPLPNGNFLAIAWEKYSQNEAQALGRLANGEVWFEKIIEIEILNNNQANIVWEWRLGDHIIQDIDSNKPNFGVISDHPELLNINFPVDSDTDWIHLNAISYNETLDQIAVSSRNLSEIWIIDHSTNTQEAASHTGGLGGKGGDFLYRFGNPQAYQRGDLEDQQFFHQHDIRWIPEGYPFAGQLMVFNNDYAQNQSSIERWEPSLIEDTYQYQINTGQPFGPAHTNYSYSNDSLYSTNQSSAQMQANGNLLICQSKGGFMFEISPNESLVWKYINPVNSNGGPGIQGGTPQFNDVFRAERYALNHPAFENLNITPGNPIELLPLDNNCEIFPTRIEKIDIKPASIFRLTNNISSDFITIENIHSTNDKANLKLYNLAGHQLMNSKINTLQTNLDISQLPSGMYVLVLEMCNRNDVFKVIKI